MIHNGRNQLFVLYLLVCMGGGVGAGIAQEQNLRRIGIATARTLANQVVNAHGTVTLTDSSRPLDPEFYYFSATWPNPKGSPMIGYFAVNPWTGDVWDVNGCKRLESRSLSKLKENIRKKSGIRKNVFSELQNKQPLCIGPQDHD